MKSVIICSQLHVITVLVGTHMGPQLYAWIHYWHVERLFLAMPSMDFDMKKHCQPDFWRRIQIRSRACVSATITYIKHCKVATANLLQVLTHKFKHLGSLLLNIVDCSYYLGDRQLLPRSHEVRFWVLKGWCYIHICIYIHKLYPRFCLLQNTYAASSWNTFNMRTYMICQRVPWMVSKQDVRWTPEGCNIMFIAYVQYSHLSLQI